MGLVFMASFTIAPLFRPTSMVSTIGVTCRMFGRRNIQSLPLNTSSNMLNWFVQHRLSADPSNDVLQIHRHHKRTVYASNSFPVESYEWNCDDEGLFYYGQPKTGHKSAHSYWQGYISPTNPFIPTGFLGTCQFPQITAEGLDDSWQHGQDLYGVYHGLLGFLPDNANEMVSFRVTQNVITSQVAGMVLNGMFNTEADIPLIIEV